MKIKLKLNFIFILLCETDYYIYLVITIASESTQTLHKNTFDNIIMARFCIGNQNLKSLNIPYDHIYFLLHPSII